MTRRIFNRLMTSTVISLVMIVCVTPSHYAQSGSGELPGGKPATPPAARPAPPRTAKPAAPVVTVITFSQPIEGRIEQRGSEKLPDGHLFVEYNMTAKADDLLSFQLETESRLLSLQILAGDNAEVQLAKDAGSGKYRISTPTGGLPADGQYRVRVIGPISARSGIPYSLTVARAGLLPSVYNERFQKIMLGYRESDPASVDETIARLEELGSDDPNKPSAFEFLGIIYLDKRRDFEKADAAMQNALKANGASVIRISYDRQWRRLGRLRGGKVDWQEPRSGWLRIQTGKVVVTDTSNKSLATLEGNKIFEIAKVVVGGKNLASVTVDGTRLPYVFMPGSGEAAEADLVIRLIQNYVMKKPE